MGSKGSQTSVTNQSQNSTYVPTGAGYLTGALNGAQTLQQAGAPTVPTAPVAGFSDMQNQAFGNINAAQGMANPYYAQANNYFSPDGAQQFFNPFADSVTAQLQNVFGQQQQQNNANLVQSAGGVGADRIAVGQGNLANQQTLAAGQIYSGLYSQAQQQAQQAGQNVAGLGTTAQNTALQGAQAQLGAGGQQQQLAQAQLNAPYQQQLAQLALPYQLAQWYSGQVGSLAPALGGSTFGSGTGNTSSQYNPSLFSQLSQIGGLGLGLLGKGSGGRVSYARGGRTNPFAFDDGGPVDISAGLFAHPSLLTRPSGIIPQTKLSQGQTHVPKVSLNLNPPQPQQQQQSGMQGLQGLAALGKALGGLSGNAWGGGSFFGGDAWGGSASHPLAGLTSADYGARGGVFARGGAPNPFALPHFDDGGGAGNDGGGGNDGGMGSAGIGGGEGQGGMSASDPGSLGGGFGGLAGDAAAVGAADTGVGFGSIGEANTSGPDPGFGMTGALGMNLGAFGIPGIGGIPGDANLGETNGNYGALADAQATMAALSGLATGVGNLGQENDNSVSNFGPNNIQGATSENEGFGWGFTDPTAHAVSPPPAALTQNNPSAMIEDALVSLADNPPKGLAGVPPPPSFQAEFAALNPDAPIPVATVPIAPTDPAPPASPEAPETDPANPSEPATPSSPSGPAPSVAAIAAALGNLGFDGGGAPALLALAQLAGRIPQGYRTPFGYSRGGAANPFRRGYADGGDVSFEDRAAPVEEAVRTGDFDPQGIDYTAFTPPAAPPASRSIAAAPAAPAPDDTEEPAAPAYAPHDRSPGAVLDRVANGQPAAAAPPPPAPPASANPFRLFGKEGYFSNLLHDPVRMALIMGGLSATTPQGFSGGFQQGLKLGQGQESVDQEAKKLEEQANYHAGLLSQKKAAQVEEDDDKNTRVSAIGDAILSGNQPPVTTGLYKDGPAVRAYIQSKGGNLQKMQLEDLAARRQVVQLNNTQTTRLLGLARSVDNTIDEVTALGEQLHQSGVPLINHINLQRLTQTQGNSPKGQLATRYLTAVKTVEEEFANAANGGYAPTEPAWKLAHAQINGDYGEQQLKASLGEVQRLIRYRINAIPNINTLGPTAPNRYTGNAGSPAAGPAQGGAPAAAPAKAPVVFQNGHRYELQPDGSYR